MTIIKIDASRYWASRRRGRGNVGVKKPPAGQLPDRKVATPVSVCQGCKQPRLNIDPSTQMCTICTTMGAPKA